MLGPGPLHHPNPTRPHGRSPRGTSAQVCSLITESRGRASAAPGCRLHKNLGAEKQLNHPHDSPSQALLRPVVFFLKEGDGEGAGCSLGAGFYGNQLQ